MNPEDQEDEWQEPDLTLSRDGKLHGMPARAPEPPRFDPDAPLELAEPRPIVPEAPPEPEPPPPLSPRSRATALGLVAALVLLAGAVWFLLARKGPAGVSLEPEPLGAVERTPGAPPPETRRAARAARAEAAGGEAAGLLTIESTPPGATVYLDDEEVGRTPYLGSNVFARGAAVRVRLTRPGFKIWTGTFKGGADARFNVRLSTAR